MFRTRLLLVATLLSAIFLVSFLPAQSATIAGTKCTKLNTTKTVSNIKYTCVKSGKKLVWNKGVAIKPTPKPSPSTTQVPELSTPTTTPTPTPVKTVETPPAVKYQKVDFTWENLFEFRKDIAYTAWSKAAETVNGSKAKYGQIEIHTGPNTKPNYLDLESAISKVSRLFPSFEEPKRILVLQYGYQDLNWATDLLKTKISTQEYQDLDRNEGGRLLSSNCREQDKVCNGSKQQTTSSGLALILQGVLAPNEINDEFSKLIFSTGMLEAHEYFHSLQRMPLMNKPVPKWPKTWYREGGANWVENVAVNFDNFSKYRNYEIVDCKGSCTRMTESEIEKYLQTADNLEVTPGFEQYVNYNLGSRFIEILVALKGPQAALEIYKEVGQGLTFESAFEKIFNKSWESAKPLIAKVVYANLQEE